VKVGYVGKNSAHTLSLIDFEFELCWQFVFFNLKVLFPFIFSEFAALIRKIIQQSVL
jgi:hypothetical protein